MSYKDKFMSDKEKDVYARSAGNEMTYRTKGMHYRRMTWNLCISYKDIEGIFGRAILTTIYESILYFRSRPRESFANIHGFNMINVMNSKNRGNHW